ncbi:cytochrome P450 [Litoreibacter ponti]|nr:cytochrome P450 [Litoreibacter ponti]
MSLALERPVDPFVAARRDPGAVVQRFGEEDLVMLLRWRDVRAAARDHAQFDSAQRGRVPTPPEHDIRPFRQLPIETNPPEHALWKAIVLPFFRRPVNPDIIPEFQDVLRSHMQRLLDGGDVEVVRDFALPVQSAALAVLLDTDRDIARVWQGWGLHALRSNGKTDPAKAARFLTFIDEMLDRGQSDPDMGLFAALHEAQFEGRPLTRDEMRGLCHLALAGGRDTLIHAISGTLAHLAAHPDDLRRLRGAPSLIPLAVEELFRVLSPLAMIGRVCPHGHEVGPLHIAPDARAGLCWAAANRDPQVFDNPLEIRIDRAPNPHVAFGACTHTCLGAPMARLILRSLLAEIVRHVAAIAVISATPRASPFGTPYLYDSLTLRLTRIEDP